MGQAKLRGTREQRMADALEGQRLHAAKREAEDQARQRKIAAAWAKLTPEEKEARLEKAKQEIAMLGVWDELVGPELAAAAMQIFHRRR